MPGYPYTPHHTCPRKGNSIERGPHSFNFCNRLSLALPLPSRQPILPYLPFSL